MHCHILNIAITYWYYYLWLWLIGDMAPTETYKINPKQMYWTKALNHQMAIAMYIHITIRRPIILSWVLLFWGMIRHAYLYCECCLLPTAWGGGIRLFVIGYWTLWNCYSGLFAAVGLGVVCRGSRYDHWIKMGKPKREKPLQTKTLLVVCRQVCCSSKICVFIII